MQLRRPLRTSLDELKPSIRENVERHQEKQREYFPGHREISFHRDEPVVARDYRTNTWKEAKIEERQSPVTYTVRTNDNHLWKRHIDQLRPRNETISEGTNDNTDLGRDYPCKRKDVMSQQKSEEDSADYPPQREVSVV